APRPPARALRGVGPRVALGAGGAGTGGAWAWGASAAGRRPGCAAWAASVWGPDAGRPDRRAPASGVRRGAAAAAFGAGLVGLAGRWAAVGGGAVPDRRTR